ncbi:LytR/AlgR family response regulator transcription factor [Mesonia aquimarina]|uniref:LytR/AlgR family response regulator transcription factor n=1 Tax=Mesonia aquimarina TaxID=1504967 RepID=UPI00196996EE|nr:LytTR family DNA-binding domain-containing protein [Mesonia aquimarina]
MKETKLKCIVVDDSSLQRLSITKLVKDHPSLELIAEHNNALKTKTALQTIKVDLLFLDIEMPILSGFDLLDNLDYKPEIIFVTGKTQYAFEAFNYKAVDYLQKPVSKDRFNIAVDKALELYGLKNDHNGNDENYIFIKSNLKKHKLYLDTVKYVEALGDYMKVITDSKNYTVLSTMKAFEERLPKEQFLRVHKSYIVNLNRVEHYNSKIVQLEQQEIPLSRNRKRNLEKALEEISTLKKE